MLASQFNGAQPVGMASGVLIGRDLKRADVSLVNSLIGHLVTWNYVTPVAPPVVTLRTLAQLGVGL